MIHSTRLRSPAGRRVTRSRNTILSGLAVLCAAPAPAEAIPYFARKYSVSCSECHVQPPKLNAYGESFRASGYRMPEREPARTVPFALWVSGRSDAFHTEPAVSTGVAAHMNKVELISGSDLTPWLSYFLEWRLVSFEPHRRADGEIGLRDRSGRFEDLFVTLFAGDFSFTAGQFRQIDQVDVSLRLGLSEPLSLSASLPGTGGATARQRALRGFSPAGRSPAVRAGWTRELPDNWVWTSTAAVPLPGELSVPLTAAAREEASNEIEWRAKGLVLESYARRGLLSFGLHSFLDGGDRLLLQAATTGKAGRLFWTGVGGFERLASATRGRWSIEATYAPHYLLALGGRLEDRAGDGAPIALHPYARVHFPGTRYTFYAAVEQRVQRGRGATLVELGTVF
jgi:hypothetical protein